MRFFLFFLFSYFCIEHTIGLFNSFFNVNGKNVLFSNNITLNIDKIPYRSHLIVKKFDIASFNFKKKPAINVKNRIKLMTTTLLEREIKTTNVHKKASTHDLIQPVYSAELKKKETKFSPN